jgi:Fe-S cluster assembly protein SufD
MSIEITKTSSQPLIVQNAAHHRTITVAENVHAQVVLETSDNSNLDVKLGPHAHLTLYSLSTSTEHKAHNLCASVLADAQFSMFEFGLMGDTTKRTTTVELMQPGASVNYCALDQLLGQADKKTELTIHHKAPHTTSSQAFRGMYAGSAKASFLGKVVVAQNAAHSSAAQLYKSILLSDQAKAYVMPQLEIYNYDIKATHGASIGELDRSALFYLCSRGIPYNEAKMLLITSLLKDILDGIKEPSIKQKYTELVHESVAQALGASR